MPKRIKVSVGALNIRLHPHPDGTYENFIRAVYRARQPIKIWGDRQAVIRSLARSPDEDGLIHGVITTYLSIDTDQPWFNDSTFDEATEEELESIVLPSNLHPNLNSFLFALDPSIHRIYFETYSDKRSFSHAQALKFFQGSAENPSILRQFGEAKITIVQSKLGLERLFSMSRITDIKVYIEKPNDIWPDDFEEHLARKNARSVTVEYKADRGLGIIPDNDIQELAGASLDDGYTEVSGYEIDGHKKLSTRGFPKSSQDKFDRDHYTAVGMFRRVIDLFKRNR